MTWERIVTTLGVLALAGVICATTFWLLWRVFGQPLLWLLGWLFSLWV